MIGDTVIIIEHNWTVIGPCGHYGLLQHQTGSGVPDVKTAILLGPIYSQIPLPIFASYFGFFLILLSTLSFRYFGKKK